MDGATVGLIELAATNAQRPDMIHDSLPIVRVARLGDERTTTQSAGDGVTDDSRPQSAPLCVVYPVSDGLLGHGHPPIIHSRNLSA